MLPPGPKLLSGLQLAYYGFDTVRFLERARDRYGPIFTIRIPFEDPFVVLSDASLIGELMDLDSDIAPPYPANRWLKPLFGEQSLLFQSGEAHRKHRKTSKPHLSPSRSEAFTEQLNQQSVEYLEATTEQEVSSYEWTLNFMMSSCLKNLMGVDDQGLKDEFTKVVLRARKHYSSFFNLTADSYMVSGDYPRLLSKIYGLAGGGTTRDSIANDFHTLLKLQVQNLDNATGAVPPTLFSQYLGQLRSGKIDEMTFLTSIMTFIIAAFDPPTIVISRLLLILSTKPALQKRICKELSCNGASQTLEASIQETMRLYPPLYAATRSIKHKVKLGDHEIPSNTNIFACIYLMQREEKCWPNAQKFDYTRFLSLCEEPTIEQGYMPYGGNKRICPGRHYAATAMTAFMKNLLMEHQLTSTKAIKVYSKIKSFGPTFTCDENATIRIEKIRN